MKSDTLTTPLVLATLGLTLLGSMSGFAQTHPMLQYDTLVAEKPKTASETLGDLQARHKKTLDEFTANLNRLPTETAFLGSKELFKWVDESTRELKNIRSGCVSLMGSLRVEAKAISPSTSFSEEQKKELLDAAESLAKECGALSDLLDHAIQRLAAAYTIFPKWNRVHKSYRNLQGETKASDVVKTEVEEYLKSFTPDPTSTPEEVSQSDT
jgi:hypothetical protein